MKGKINELLNTTWTYALIVLFTQVLGYLYKISYIGYFNVNMTFYSFNLFNDFSIPLIAILFFLIPIFSASIVGILIYNFALIPNYKQWLKDIGIKNILKYLFLYAILTIMLSTPFICVSLFLELSLYNTICTYLVIVLAVIIISAMVGVIKKYIKNNGEDTNNNDVFDKLFSIIMIVIVLFGIVYIVIDFGEAMAVEQKSFMFLENEYVILYNNKDYAIVSRFEINNDILEIFSKETIKLDLNDKIITNKSFKDVIVHK